MALAKMDIQIVVADEMLVAVRTGNSLFSFVGYTGDVVEQIHGVFGLFVYGLGMFAPLVPEVDISDVIYESSLCAELVAAALRVRPIVEIFPR